MMDGELVLQVVMRWLHILAAVVAVGGTIFLRFVLMPVAGRVLEENVHTELRAGLVRRWQPFLHTCILLFLVSGFYNYLAVTRHLHDDQPLYHALFGVKFLLALAVFALGLILTSRKAYAEKFRQNAKLWLGVLAALAVAIVLISGVMKNLPTAAPAEGLSIEVNVSAE